MISLTLTRAGCLMSEVRRNLLLQVWSGESGG